jgi:hypothetical protein
MQMGKGQAHTEDHHENQGTEDIAHDMLKIEQRK